MTQSKPEEVSREEIEGIFSEHGVCSWWPKFQFSDCKVNIISDLEALFQQKLEQERKEMDRIVRELETALEGVNHELVKNYEKEIVMLKSDLARAIGYCQGLGHPDKYLEQKYLEQKCPELLETLGGRK